ncbi:MAG: hypothetical protein MK132_04495 [Lentisphaerales bacterium]|nr:hypothetical protein [Lentisphaerales bacterium]
MSDNNPEIRLKKDDTSSVARDQDILKKTSRFDKTDSTRIKKAELNDDVNTQAVVKPKVSLNSGEDVLDPMTLRDSDTSKLKKIKPKSSTQTISLDSENISDTVHLKVIKEKKKQLAGILTASQTIRLRPPSDSGKTQSPASEDTKMKLGAPAPGGTVNMSPQGSPVGTLKINMPATSSESGTIKVSKPSFPGSQAPSGTLKIKSPVAGQSGGSTLKIKSTEQSGVAPSGTLKLKSASADQTVRMSGSSSGGTLKLKGASTSLSSSTSRKQINNTADDVTSFDGLDDDSRLKPGIMMTLNTLMTIAALGFAVFKLFDNYTKLFQ